MKYMSLVLMMVGILMLPTTFCFSQYSITGKIRGYRGTVCLLMPNMEGTCDTLGTFSSTDGAFRFKGKISEPAAVRITASAIRMDIPVLLENASYVITANTNKPSSFMVEGGGKLQQERNEFQLIENAFSHMRDSVRAACKKEYGADDFFGQIQLKGMLDKINQRYEEAEDSFIYSHDNLVSAYIVARRLKPLMQNKLLASKYKLLGISARNTILGKYLKPYADKIASIVVGGTAPNLTMQTPDGDTLSIYDVKSKIKLIDFWASWCGPCRAENPNLKRIYAKYKSRGLEIISISLDSKKEAWRKAIADDGLPWKHMSDLKGWNSAACDIYEIHAIPHIFILDANNRIIGERLRGKELEDTIASLL